MLFSDVVGGATQRQSGVDESNLIEEYGAYDIIGDQVFVAEPVSSPMTEHDYRFKGLREFVEERDPKRIAVNYIQDLGSWPTQNFNQYNRGAKDGISHTDYLLLAEELGDKYANRLVSSEYMMVDYIISPVPSEIQLLKKMRKDEVERANKVFAEIVPGVTKNRDAVTTNFSRRSTGISQRGWSLGYENSVIQKRRHRCITKPGNVCLCAP